MGLPSLSLRRPVFAIVINIIIILFGVIGYTFLGVREYPSLDPPVINVRTSYTGANADIIESQITEPLENAINGVQGIRTISSASNQGSSNITVEFDLGADLETAAMMCAIKCRKLFVYYHKILMLLQWFLKQMPTQMLSFP